MGLSTQDQRYTSWFDRDGDNRDDGLSGRENSAIDHILVSEKVCCPMTMPCIVANVSTFTKEIRAQMTCSTRCVAAFLLFLINLHLIMVTQRMLESCATHRVPL